VETGSVVVCVISIGNELLNGDTLNSNLTYLGGRLAELGVPLQQEFCVPDERAAIGDALRAALPVSDLVVTIGGLGPTGDDLTREVVAGVLGRPLHEDAAVAAAIRAYLGRRGVGVPAEAVRLQSLVPEAADVLPNRNGTAPGLWCEIPGKGAVVMLPGPPSEFGPLVDEAVVPRVRSRLPAGLAAPRVVRIAGLGESWVEERVTAALRELPPMTVAYCAKPGCITVRFTDPEHPDRLEQAECRVREAFGDLALPASCASPQEHVAMLLQARGLRLATAESCTGGLIAAAATEIPGASAWFVGAAVVYANEWKESLLGVSAEALAQHGAVSEPVVQGMLAGLGARFAADAGIAVSGVAGPTGGSSEKPVGTVFVGVAVPGHTEVARVLFPGNRRTVRERTVATAFVMLRKALLEHPGEGGR